jgi:hypothetical protein
VTADDFLRLAWHARRDGRKALHEAMLTLAVAEGGAGEGWPDRCRARLLAERPKHFLGTHPTLERTLANPQVAEAIRKLRGQYPEGRVGWLLFRAECEAGPYTGEPAPIAAIIEALAGAPAEAEVRRDPAEPARGPRARSRARVRVGAAPGGPLRMVAAGLDGPAVDVSPADETGEETTAFYLAVLLSIAMLLAVVERDRADRAA